ncbi:TetR/AcrR family transcriptional regulator [Cupriavidus pinatubonensis]|uniref:TetR/AcrR family transcriptional regulator n=1 Tax=Cupriavidus pinatubonensis TaxID=248026 RepID=UPI0035931505
MLSLVEILIRPMPPDRPSPRKTTKLRAERRGPGRPSAGNPGQRDQLLDAATELFARHGVAATSIRAIAEHAGVTPALVHYYFRDRDQLLDAIVEERLQQLVDAIFTPSATPEDPVAMLVGIASRLIRVAAATPWFPGLWIREVAGVDGLLRERVLNRFALQRAGALSAPLAAAIAGGKLNPGLEPTLVMPSLVGLTLLPLATTHIWQRLPGAEHIDTEALVRHVSTLLTQGLTPTAPAPRDGASD